MKVLEKSWVNIDGVDVSLRLCDTFGDHHKDIIRTDGLRMKGQLFGEIGILILFSQV